MITHILIDYFNVYWIFADNIKVCRGSVDDIFDYLFEDGDEPNWVNIVRTMKAIKRSNANDCYCWHSVSTQKKCPPLKITEITKIEKGNIYFRAEAGDIKLIDSVEHHGGLKYKINKYFAIDYCYEGGSGEDLLNLLEQFNHKGKE